MIARVLAADPKPASSKKRPLTAEERAARAIFKPTVLRLDGGCVVHRYHPDLCEGPLQAHHVIQQQTLRKWNLFKELWDPRVGMTVCERVHERHTLAVERIPLNAIPGRCLRFAREYGFVEYLERFYAPPQ